MGQGIRQTHFTAADHERFGKRLQSQFRTLKRLCQKKEFGSDQRSFGAEVELYIIDNQAAPYALNMALRKSATVKNLTLELNQYNLEYNFEPIIQAHTRPFSALEKQWIEAYAALEQTANTQNARLVTIGILPTLRQSHLGAEVITPEPRYLALNQALRCQALPFSIALTGQDRVQLNLQDVSAEGANASFQFHYRCPFDRLPTLYNAAQLITPLVLAISGNSPFFLGQRLWHETRIGLFKQAVDTRLTTERMAHFPERVYFGFGWLRQSIEELFAQNIAFFPPLLPVCEPELKTQPPTLNALRLHQSCIWPWNRPIYDPSQGGHIRLELRALPSGPTATDMFANAALIIGLMEGIAPWVETLMNSLPFHLAESNFYRAAQHGLVSELLWPTMPNGRLSQALRPLQSLNAQTLLKNLLPYAYQGLDTIGIETTERQNYLGVIEDRLATGQTGAQWQLWQYEQLAKHNPHAQALRKLVESYHGLCLQNTPVHNWPIT